jgi:hypothetical protein
MSFISYKEFCATNVINLLDGIKVLQDNEPWSVATHFIYVFYTMQHSYGWALCKYSIFRFKFSHLDYVVQFHLWLIACQTSISVQCKSVKILERSASSAVSAVRTNKRMRPYQPLCRYVLCMVIANVFQ